MLLSKTVERAKRCLEEKWVNGQILGLYKARHSKAPTAEVLMTSAEHKHSTTFWSLVPKKP